MGLFGKKKEDKSTLYSPGGQPDFQCRLLCELQNQGILFCRVAYRNGDGKQNGSGSAGSVYPGKYGIEAAAEGCWV